MAVVLGIGASACGSDAPGPDAQAGVTTATAASALPKIMIGGGGVNGEAMSVASGDMKMTGRPMMLTEYRWVGDPVDITSPATAWKFGARADVTDDQLARLAATFGVEGEVTRLSADQGGGRMVGPDDWSGPAVMLFEDALGSWSYQNPLPIGAPAVACVSPGYDPSATDTSGGEAGDGEGDASGDVVECAEPQPPANVPTEVEAERLAREMFASIGVDLDESMVEVYADDWGASVTAWSLVGGVRSSLATTVGFGADAEVTWASGFFGTPEPVADYPRIGLEAAVERLNEQSNGWWSPYPVAIDPAGPASSDAATSDAATSDAAVSSETLVAPEPAPAPETVPDADTAPDGQTESSSATIPEPETMIVDLVAVAPQLEMVWDADGSVWLVPAYSFTTSEGWTITAFALSDEYLVQPQVEPMPEPMPEPAPAPDAPVAPLDEVAALVVGLPEDEAVAIAESNGWILRVARLDGEDLAVTADYVINRYDVEVTDGAVTAVLSNG